MPYSFTREQKNVVVLIPEAERETVTSSCGCCCHLTAEKFGADLTARSPSRSLGVPLWLRTRLLKTSVMLSIHARQPACSSGGSLREREREREGGLGHHTFHFNIERQLIPPHTHNLVYMTINFRLMAAVLTFGENPLSLHPFPHFPSLISIMQSWLHPLQHVSVAGRHGCQ